MLGELTLYNWKCYHCSANKHINKDLNFESHDQSISNLLATTLTVRQVLCFSPLPLLFLPHLAAHLTLTTLRKDRKGWFYTTFLSFSLPSHCPSWAVLTHHTVIRPSLSTLHHSNQTFPLCVFSWPHSHMSAQISTQATAFHIYSIGSVHVY